jgi:gas vesicle protein
MMNDGNKVGTILTFALGAGAGAVAALLLAPKTGNDLRRDLAEGASEAGKQISHKSKQMKQRAMNVMDRAQDTMQEAVDAGQQAYNDAKIS